MIFWAYSENNKALNVGFTLINNIGVLDSFDTLDGRM